MKKNMILGKRNASLLFERLWEVSDGLTDGSMRPADAKERNNNSGKMIALAKLQLEHQIGMRKYPDISVPFLDNEGNDTESE